MLRLAGLALLGLMLAAPSRPTAASAGSFCGGALVATSFYRILISTEQPRRSEYRARLRFEEPGPDGRILTATLVPLSRIHGHRVIRPAIPFEVGLVEAVDVALLSLPAHPGVPNAATVGGAIDFVCTVRFVAPGDAPAVR